MARGHCLGEGRQGLDLQRGDGLLAGPGRCSGAQPQEAHSTSASEGRPQATWRERQE